jgi:hypothetical protein
MTAVTRINTEQLPPTDARLWATSGQRQLRALVYARLRRCRERCRSACGRSACPSNAASSSTSACTSAGSATPTTSTSTRWNCSGSGRSGCCGCTSMPRSELVRRARAWPGVHGWPGERAERWLDQLDPSTVESRDARHFRRITSASPDSRPGSASAAITDSTSRGQFQGPEISAIAACPMWAIRTQPARRYRS